MFRGFILYLLVITFAIFSNFQAHFYNFWENKHDDPILFLVKMIADIFIYTISKLGTLFNFGNFLIVFFSWIEILENNEKIFNNNICYKVCNKTCTLIFA